MPDDFDRPTPPATPPTDRDPAEGPPPVSTRDIIDEALRKQAARRPPAPPKVLPMPPMIPRQPKPARDRKKRRRP